MQLSNLDIEFFSSPLNWQSGPMYEVNLYIPSDTAPARIESTVFDAGNLTAWEGVERPPLLKSLMQIVKFHASKIGTIISSFNPQNAYFHLVVNIVHSGYRYYG